MSKHTPGPWNVSQSGMNVTAAFDDVSGHVIANCDHDLKSYDECRANASLIAAAPELLNALKQLLASHDATCPGESCPLTGIDVARYVVAKAEGRKE